MTIDIQQINDNLVQNYRAQNRPVVLLAPDALVLLNRNLTIPVSRSDGSSGHLDLQRYITSITTQLGINSVPGSASFTMAVPRNKMNDFYDQNGNLTIWPMMEVEIIIKGRFLDQGDNPCYYRCFWGFVTAISESLSDGYHTVHVECQDILKWWDLTENEIAPSAQSAFLQGNKKSTVWATKFINFKPHEIIMALAYDSMFDMAGLNNFLVTNSENFKLLMGEFQWNRDNLFDYWFNRFKEIAGNLRIFGLSTKTGAFALMQQLAKQETTALGNEANVTGNSSAIYQDQIKLMDRVTQYEMDLQMLENTQPFYTPFSDHSSLMTTTRETNLNIARQVKDTVGWEFFMDVTGEIIFKPPLFNLDTSNNPVSRLEDTDIIGWDITENLNEVFTRIDVQGSVMPGVSPGGNNGPYGFYIDWNLAKQFGIKSAPAVTKNYLYTNETCTLYAIMELSLLNAKRFSGTITIIGRPEIRLGYPVYVPSLDAYFYVTGISHNFSFGSTFTTQLTVEARRRPFIPPLTTLVATPLGSTGTPVHTRYSDNVLEVSLAGALPQSFSSDTESGASSAGKALLGAGTITTEAPDFMGTFKKMAAGLSAQSKVDSNVLAALKKLPGLDKLEAGGSIVEALAPKDVDANHPENVVSYIRAFESDSLLKYTLDKDHINLDALNNPLTGTKLTWKQILENSSVLVTNSNQSGKKEVTVAFEQPNSSTNSEQGNSIANSKYVSYTSQASISYPTVQTVVGDIKYLLPVSDSLGYELIGGMPYGRGYRISVESQYEEVQASKNKQGTGGLDITQSANVAYSIEGVKGIPDVMSGTDNATNANVTLTINPNNAAVDIALIKALSN